MQDHRAFVEKQLGAVQLKDLGVSLLEAATLLLCDRSEHGWRIGLQFAFPNQTQHDAIRQLVADAFAPDAVEVEFDNKIEPKRVQDGVKRIPTIKNMIAVSSAKGGVGKSTVAVNLALSLMKEGACVGLLDADLYGPSMPIMLGTNDRPSSEDGHSMHPIMAYGLQTMSIGYLLDNNTAAIWRGPIVSQTIQQLLSETNWHDLDYLIVDCPPGTGDIQLTMSQKMPISGAVVVTTPQEVALSDVRKGINMFEKTRVPLLGVIENMSGYQCPHCGHEDAIFSKGGGERAARQFSTEWLGSVPLLSAIGEGGDKGLPVVLENLAMANRFCAIARAMAYVLARQPKDYASRLPDVVLATELK